jgi:hypothetical protein
MVLFNFAFGGKVINSHCCKGMKQSLTYRFVLYSIEIALYLAMTHG